MSRTRLHIAFVGTVMATAAMVFMVGPESVVSLAVVFLGFVLLYLSGLGTATREAGSRPRAAPARGTPDRQARPTPDAKRTEPPSRGRDAATDGASTAPTRERDAASPLGSVAEGARGAGAGTPRAEDEERLEPPRPVPGPHEDLGPEDTAPGASTGDDANPEARSREESRWLDEQLSGDVDDIAFLPPYASDSVEEAQEGEVEADLEDWVPPGFPASLPRPGEEAAEAVESYRNVPIPRHFALGTVAIIRDLMEPAQVAQVLLEQRRQPKQQFGTLAVEMGFLTPEQLRELLLAQQEGLFTDEEIRSARSRLRAFRATEASSP